MEVSSNATRTRVVAAAISLGLIFGAFVYLDSPGGGPSEEFQGAATTSPSGETHLSPGGSGGLLPPLPPGKSIPAKRKDVQASPLRGHDLKTAWTQSTTRLKYLDHCEKSQACAEFDNSEAYTYDLSVRRLQATEIREFASISLAWQGERGGDLPMEAQKLARYFLATGNDDVKEAALALIEHADFSKENVNAAFSAVEDSASGPLMKDLLKSRLVKACGDQDFAGRCLKLIAHTMRQGGENMKHTLARYSLEITTPQTYRVLARAESQLDGRSRDRELFRLNREEYERFQHGG